MRTSLLFMLSLVLAACAAPAPQNVPMRAVGGDKNQGVMQLSVTYAPGKERLYWSQAQSEANMRCRAWGFASAMPFDDTTKYCTSPNADGTCGQITVTRTYQCSVI